MLLLINYVLVVKKKKIAFHKAVGGGLGKARELMSIKKQKRPSINCWGV
jgi:hypothetical protein